jgi:hypothetical protein
LIGVEACGDCRWFLELVEQLDHQVWVGDAAQIRASYVRRQGWWSGQKAPTETINAICQS